MSKISKYKTYTKGLVVSTAVAIIAVIIAKLISFSAATVAIILGMIIGNKFPFLNKKGSEYLSGIKFAEKDLLMFAIALLGINLNFTILASLGVKTIFIIVIAMVFTIFMGVFLGKLFKINPKLALMIGIGNAVCGSSAIAATSGVAKVKSDDVAISIALVNLMGTVGIFLAPFLAYLLHFNDFDAGVFVGNTLQAVGQVVAGGFSISDEAGMNATVVKMGRVLLLAPLVFILIYLAKRESAKNADEQETQAKVGFPSFILWFLFFVVLASFQVLPKAVEEVISATSHYISLIAMSAIGLMIHFDTIKESASTAFKVSTILFAMQLALSAVLITVL
ncbi:MAG: putative sulfate exporter family transporter [Campylobacterales bacterium]